ncbi:MAG: hypothetical protein V4498_08410 [candidate division FCPU426 bacterium]
MLNSLFSKKVVKESTKVSPRLLIFVCLACFASICLAGSISFDDFGKLPIWKSNEIHYSEKSENENRPVNREWEKYPKDKFWYSIETGEVELSILPDKDPDPERQGILGIPIARLMLTDRVYGVIFLEHGTYDLTRLYVYPLSKTNKLERGFLLADHFGDDETVIEISSRIERRKNDCTINVLVVNTEYDEDSEKTKVSKKKLVWTYSAKSGFKEKLAAKSH